MFVLKAKRVFRCSLAQISSSPRRLRLQFVRRRNPKLHRGRWSGLLRLQWRCGGLLLLLQRWRHRWHGWQTLGVARAATKSIDPCSLRLQRWREHGVDGAGLLRLEGRLELGLETCGLWSQRLKAAGLLLLRPWVGKGGARLLAVDVGLLILIIGLLCGELERLCIPSLLGLESATELTKSLILLPKACRLREDWRLIVLLLLPHLIQVIETLTRGRKLGLLITRLKTCELGL